MNFIIFSNFRSAATTTTNFTLRPAAEQQSIGLRRSATAAAIDIVRRPKANRIQFWSTNPTTFDQFNVLSSTADSAVVLLRRNSDQHGRSLRQHQHANIDIRCNCNACIRSIDIDARSRNIYRQVQSTPRRRNDAERCNNFICSDETAMYNFHEGIPREIT